MRKSNFIGLILVLVASVSLAADTTAAPKKKKLTLQDLLKSSSSSSSKRSATVAGVRGLEETGGEVDTKVRNFVAVERLEAVVVKDDELKRFLEEGKLH